MAEYQGILAGLGDKEHRINEITPKMTAHQMLSLRGYDYGVLASIMDAFKLDILNTSVTIRSGQCEVYGYSGYIDVPVTFTYTPQATKQYWYIYAEIDLSVQPNTFKIKDYNNQSSPTKTDWRQDNLHLNPTGKFELPLWRFELQETITGQQRVSPILDASIKATYEKIYSIIVPVVNDLALNNWVTYDPPLVDPLNKGPLFGITHGKDLYIACGYRGYIFSSPDPANWTLRATANNNYSLHGVIFAQDRFVAYGEMGTIITSTDGLTWQTVNTAGPSFECCTFGNGRFVAIGWGTSGSNYISRVFTSQDGQTWTQGAHVFSGIIRDVIYDGTRFVAVSSLGYIFTSENGTSWTEASSIPALDIHSIIYADGLYIVGGIGGPIYTSRNLNFWEPQSASATASDGISAIGYSGSFFAACAASKVLISTDGKMWTPKNINAMHEITDLVIVKDVFVVCGNGQDQAARVATTKVITE